MLALGARIRGREARGLMGEVVIVAVSDEAYRRSRLQILAQPASSKRHGAARLESDAQVDEAEYNERRHSPVRAILEWPRSRHVH